MLTPEQFDPADPEIQRNPYGYYPMLRDQAPVLQAKFGEQPCWILSRREDIAKALMDPATFSSRTTPIPNMLFSDEPEHGRLRKMVGDMFNRTAIQPMTPRIRERAEELIATILPHGSCDVIDEFAGPLTVTVVGLVLGIPVLEVERLRQMTRLQMEFVLAMRLGREPSVAARQASEGLIAFLADIIHARGYESDGVVAALAGRMEAGELTLEGCAQFAVMLLIAGHSTTTNLIGNAVFLMAQRPGDLAQMRASEAFTAAFVEEVLRTRPSFHRSIRVVTRDVEMHGVTIPAGGVVRLLLASANRDAAFFANPEEFDPDQKRRMNLAFGQGIHTCLGNWLARLEAVTALDVLARRIATVELDPERAPVRVAGCTFNEFGFEHLPVRLSPLAAAHRRDEPIARPA